MKIDLNDPLTVLILGVIASLIAAVIYALLKGELKPGFRIFESLGGGKMKKQVWKPTDKHWKIEPYVFPTPG